MYDIKLHPDNFNVFDLPFEERVKDIKEDGSNAYKIFLANFINYVHNYFEYIDFIDNPVSFKNEKQSDIYNDFIKGYLKGYNYSEPIEFSPINNFCYFELNEIKLTNEKDKIKLYKDFILKYRNIFKRIDWLVENNFNSFYHTSYTDFAHKIYDTSLINFESLDRELKVLIRDVIVLIKTRLISDLRFNHNEHLLPVIQFDFEYHLNPILITNKEDLSKYQNSIFDWVKYVFKEIKVKGLINIEIPNENIFEAVLNKIDFYRNKEEVDTIDIDYPKHIFKNATAYLIFHKMATQYASTVFISFIYRRMSEKENPNLIVASAAVFMKWFNEQSYAIKLEYTPKTLEQSENHEREAFYTLVKSFIIKN